jgi:hypothetical protein
MATWNIYCEIEGQPLYASIELDDDEYPDKEDAWDYAAQCLRETLEVTKGEY